MQFPPVWLLAPRWHLDHCWGEEKPRMLLENILSMLLSFLLLLLLWARYEDHQNQICQQVSKMDCNCKLIIHRVYLFRKKLLMRWSVMRTTLSEGCLSSTHIRMAPSKTWRNAGSTQTSTRTRDLIWSSTSLKCAASTCKVTLRIQMT